MKNASFRFSESYLKEEKSGQTQPKLPKLKKELLLLFCSINFLINHIIPNQSMILELLYLLIIKDEQVFTWDQPQEIAFNPVKKLLSHAPVLLLYNPK